MAERHVLVTVRIGPTGSFCREPDYGDACPYLDTDVGLRPQMRCLLHRDPKGEPVDLDDHDTLGSDGDLDFFQPRRATVRRLYAVTQAAHSVVEAWRAA